MKAISYDLRKLGKQLLLTLVAGGTLLEATCLENPSAYWAASLGQLGGSVATEYVRSIIYQALQIDPFLRMF